MSRRDDVESLAYVAMDLVHGQLPWHKLENIEKAKKYQETLYKKKTINVKRWCSQLPAVFYDFMMYARHMKFAETPQYDLWISRFLSAAKTRQKSSTWMVTGPSSIYPNSTSSEY